MPDPKRAYLRKKFTSTKKAHFTEGWVEFKDKRVARSVADMLNAQPIGGKKGTRWRDDVWTMKYLPKFKWNMLTEQIGMHSLPLSIWSLITILLSILIAHEAAIHTARLRVELEQSRKEQREYLRQVELARVLDKRAGRKREAAQEKGIVVDSEGSQFYGLKKRPHEETGHDRPTKSRRKEPGGDAQASERSQDLKRILGNIF